MRKTPRYFETYKLHAVVSSDGDMLALYLEISEKVQGGCRKNQGQIETFTEGAF